MAKQPLIRAYYYGNWKKDEYAGYRYQLYLHDPNLLNELHDFILDEFEIPKHYQIKYWQGLQKTENISFNSQGLTDLIEYLSDHQLEPELTQQLIGFQSKIHNQENLLDQKRELRKHYVRDLRLTGLSTIGAIWAWPIALSMFKYYAVTSSLSSEFVDNNPKMTLMGFAGTLVGLLFIVIGIVSVCFVAFKAIVLSFKMAQQIHDSYLFRWLRSFKQLRTYELDGHKIVAKREVH